MKERGGIFTNTAIRTAAAVAAASAALGIGIDRALANPGDPNQFEVPTGVSGIPQDVKNYLGEHPGSYITTWHNEPGVVVLVDPNYPEGLPAGKSKGGYLPSGGTLLHLPYQDDKSASVLYETNNIGWGSWNLPKR